MRLAPATALGTAATLGGLALLNAYRSWAEERAAPPVGHFLDADGARVHYVERGEGRPVVLIHGAGSMIQDFGTSILDRAAERWRVVAIDRPGYGYSTRPRGRRWTPQVQAALLHRTLEKLDVERPVILGHSWGSLVALAYALAYPQATAGILLVGGYYFPTPRLDAKVAAVPALPVLGPIYRNTVAPLAGRMIAERVIEKVFAPNKVPEAFWDGFPLELGLRPGQLRANGEDAGMMQVEAEALARHHHEVVVPTVIMAGESDEIVDPHRHSLELHRRIKHSALYLVPRTGHMVHHIRPTEVLDAIEVVWQQAAAGA